MSSKAGSKKNKKPKGKPGSKMKLELSKDESVLVKPVPTSVQTVPDLVELLQTATPEVQDFLKRECEFMVECRVCRSIFRSVANFIIHKKHYCCETYRNCHRNNFPPEGPTVCTNNFIENSLVKQSNGQTSLPKVSGLNMVLNKLKKIQDVNDFVDDIIEEDLENDKPEKKRKKVNLIEGCFEMEKIADNSAVMFQTFALSDADGEKIKSEVMEIHEILDNNEAILGPDGKVRVLRPNSRYPHQHMKCKECNQTFLTKKTLRYHVRYKHNASRIIYLCPICKESYANPWSVYRHLAKLHRKTAAQIRKMRPCIMDGALRRDQEPERTRNEIEVESDDADNQWLHDIECDKDFQMCGGCGKHFERKAALYSHAQMCAKRLAVRNNIAKRKDEESKLKSAELVNNRLKGSAKRKPKLVRNIKKEEDEIEEVPCNEVIEEIDPEKILSIIGVDESYVHKSSVLEDEENKENEFYNKALPHMNPVTLFCNSCRLTCDSLNDLLEHMAKHFSQYRFQCPCCSFTSYQSVTCEKHLVEEHGESNKLVLPIPSWKSMIDSHDFKDLKPSNEIEIIEIKEEPAEENNKQCLEEDTKEVEYVGITNNNVEIVENDSSIKVPQPIEFYDCNDIAQEVRIENNIGNVFPFEDIIKERPKRNRVKSVKTSQKDFLYDLSTIFRDCINGPKSKKNKAVKAAKIVDHSYHAVKEETS